MRMAEVAREHSLPFGYDEMFVNPVDEDFLCPICRLPAKEPIQTSCGHRFCAQCIEEYLQRNERQGQYCTCPVDRETVLRRDKDHIFPDKATKRKILSLPIKCPNDGCGWTNELREKENHLVSCEFQVVRCTHENCQVMVVRKDLESHRIRECPWQIINCSYCQEPYAACQEKDHHNNCRRFPTLCDCGAVVSREMVPREKRELHLQSATEQHIKLVKEELTKTTRDLNGLEEQVKDLQNKNEERCEALQNKVNAIKGQFEKEVQIFKVESQNLYAAFEEKKNDLRKEFEERVNDLRDQFEGKVNINQREDKERCRTLEKEMNALRRQHDEDARVLKEECEKKVDILQKELAACEKKVITLEKEVNTNRNERAACEEEGNNQRRQLDERFRNIEEELDQVNWYTNVKIIVSAVLVGATIIFAIVNIFANNQRRQLDERVRNTEEELAWVNWKTNVNIIVSVGAAIIFAIVKF